MWSMIWPIALVVGVNVFYHITTKSTPEGVNAFASLAITYGVGAVLSIVMFYLTGARGLAGELGKTNWTAWVLGIAVVGLEFGNICLYRAGWKVSVGSLIANITLACVPWACCFITRPSRSVRASAFSSALRASISWARNTGRTELHKKRTA